MFTEGETQDQDEHAEQPQHAEAQPQDAPWTQQATESVPVVGDLDGNHVNTGVIEDTPWAIESHREDDSTSNGAEEHSDAILDEESTSESDQLPVEGEEQAEIEMDPKSPEGAESVSAVREKLANLKMWEIMSHVRELLAIGVESEDVLSEIKTRRAEAGPNLEGAVEEMLDAGLNANRLAELLSSPGICRHLRKLLEHGADAETTLSLIDRDGNYMYHYIDGIVQSGIDRIVLAAYLEKNHPLLAVHCIGELQAAGANVDLDDIVSRIKGDDVYENLKKLISAGANADKLAQRMDARTIAYCVDKLQAAGANINVQSILSELDSYDVLCNLNRLLRAGADSDEVLARLDSPDIFDNVAGTAAFDRLLEAGASPDKLAGKLGRYGNYSSILQRLLEAGANVDVVLENIRPGSMLRADMLLDAGVSPEAVIAKLSLEGLAQNLERLVADGAAIDKIVSLLKSEDITKYRLIDRLLTVGADSKQVLYRFR